MSITYPFTINNEKELSQHIQTHIQTYKELYNYLLSDKLHKLQLQNNELVNVISLQKSSTGTHSNNKGKLFESNIQHLVTKLIEDNIDWQIDCNKNITKCMDVRLIYKGEYTVGIECKDKKIITQKDITKLLGMSHIMFQNIVALASRRRNHHHKRRHGHRMTCDRPVLCTSCCHP